MNELLRQEVRQEADFRCEYCHVRERHLPFSAFHLDHVLPRQHGGGDDPSNLAWSCQECNLLKGTNLCGVDPDTGAVVRLFHLRKDKWDQHFELMGVRVLGKTPRGRATAWLLQMNAAARLELRATLLALGDL